MPHHYMLGILLVLIMYGFFAESVQQRQTDGEARSLGVLARPATISNCRCRDQVPTGSCCHAKLGDQESESTPIILLHTILYIPRK